MSGITCPHCEEGISKSYTIQALAMLAKSEGIDLGDELEQLAAAGLAEEVDDVDDDETDKGYGGKKAARSSPTGYAGNKTASHRGKAPGKGHHFSNRAGGKGDVQRKNTPTNPATEGGMAKSLSLPVNVGDAQIVQYTDGSDSFVSKGVEDGNFHTPVARNLRAERERHTGESTPQ